MLRVFVAVCVLLVDRGIGHTHFSPLDFLRHDKASVKWGKPLARGFARVTVAVCGMIDRITIYCYLIGQYILTLRNAFTVQ